MTTVTESTKPRLLFCSYHSYLDPSSGAALSTRELLEMMQAHGWPCAALTGPQLDFEQGVSLEQVIGAEDPHFKYRPGKVLDTPCTLYQCVRGGVGVHCFVPASPPPHKQPGLAEGRAFLSLFEHVRRRFRPNILLTYGGHAVTFHLIRRAKENGIKVVFGLHNLQYNSADVFRDVDAVKVPSRASQEHYRRTLGLTSTVLPGPFNWDRVLCPKVEGRFVTFVNPQPTKGVFWFARIAYELNDRRPDIPLLVVEGRGKVDWLARSGLDLSGLKNVHRMPNTPDPRKFYALSRMILMPSLWQEAFGRVAVEAMINGIPVLASRRGGLPEALGGAGFLFDIPEEYTPQTRHAPSAEEVAPWIEIIERLWDDKAFYAAEQQHCRQAAEVWRPVRLWPRFQDFFLHLLKSSH